MILYGDLETFCELDLKQVGAYPYAERAEIMLFPYAIDDGPVKCWDATTGEPMPEELCVAIARNSVQVVFQNGGQFDRIVLKARKMPIAIERWYDTMVQAMAHSLPGSLDKLCDIFKLEADQAKLKDGNKLIHLFCKPQPKSCKLRRATRLTHPAEWQRFIQYAKQDVEAMRILHKKMPTWNYKFPDGPDDHSAGAREWRLWCYDQRSNDRGMLIDQDLAKAVVALITDEKAVLAQQAQAMTDGALHATTQRDQLLKYLLAEHSVSLPDLTASTLNRRLEDPDLPDGVKLLLQNRIEASTVSTAKYKTLLRSLTSDGRLCGSTQFNGAGRTRRWSGRRFQPQNMKRPNQTPGEIDVLIDAVKAGEDISLLSDNISLLSDNIMTATSNMLRGCIIARPGHKLIAADLSNIEGRILAWLAGEEWKLKAFRDFDAGIGHDLYKLTYAMTFNIKPEDVTKAQRQLGKVEDLAFGYQGGVGSCLTFAAAYDLDLTTMADAVLPVVPRNVLNDAAETWIWAEKKKKTMGLDRRTYTACDSVKRMWRGAHGATVQFWADVKSAVERAFWKKGSVQTCGKLKIVRDGAWLKIILPSGCALSYPSYQIDDRGQHSYMGVDQYTRQWKRIKTYEGKLVENIVQSLARDVFAYEYPAIVDAGYEMLLTVHDEAVPEAPDTPEYSVDGLITLMTREKPWAPGLPLAAAGFESPRYYKD